MLFAVRRLVDEQEDAQDRQHHGVIEWLEAAFAERNGEMVFLETYIAGAAADDPLRQMGREPRVRTLLDSTPAELGVTSRR